MNPKFVSHALGNRRIFLFSSYGLVFLMMACVILTLSNLLQNIMPGWRAGLIASIASFIVIDQLYMHRHWKSITPLSAEWLTTVGAQWIVIALLIRLLLSYANGLAALGTDLSRVVRGHLENLFTGEFVIVLFLAFVMWILTSQFLELLDEIGLDVKWTLSDEALIVEPGTISAHQRLVNLIFTVGIVLVVFTALARLDLRTTFSNTSGFPTLTWNRLSGAETGALLYFVFGLALLSLSRLMSLQTHWNRLRIPVSSKNLVRQWGVYSLCFLFILAVIVSLLPAGDSLGFFSLLGTLVNFLIGVLVFIMLFVGMLVSLLFTLPFLLLGRGSPSSPLPPPTMPPLPTQNQTPFTPGPLWELVRSILLWGGLAAILLFAFVHFVRQHEEILAAMRRSRITNWLILAWQWLYRNVNKTGIALSRTVAQGWQNIVARLEGRRVLPRPGWISLRSLDPRRQIYFFYLALVRRGEEQGLTRKPSQTPAEYARTLERAVPAVEEDIDSITDAFIEARYSRRDIDSNEADLVKATWGRIRRALQSKSKNG